MKKMSFAAAMRDYFGDRPGATGPGAFLAELKALTFEDRAWFRQHLPSVGYEII